MVDETSAGRLNSDIRAYLRVIASAQVKPNAFKVINTYEKALVYSMMDRSVSQIKLQQTTGVPQRTISDWMLAFVELGLAAPPDEFNQNHRALFTLRELGIDLGSLKKRKSMTTTVDQSANGAMA